MKPLLIAALLGLASISSGCSYLNFGDGPYQGRLLDRETKRPIEGAVVLATWWRESASVTQPNRAIHDVHEAVTDKEGNFSITGSSRALLSPNTRVREPIFSIFMPGYEAVPEKKLLPLEKDRGMVIHIRELITAEERIKNLQKVTVENCAREKKCPNLMKLWEVEARALGLLQKEPKKD